MTDSKWADGQAHKAAAYLERHTEDYGTGYVEVPGWALAEAAEMIRDFAEEIATLRAVNEAQAEQIRQAQQALRNARDSALEAAE
jgi:hypothetical protein